MLVYNILLALSVVTNSGLDENARGTVKGYKNGNRYSLAVATIHQRDTRGALLLLSIKAAENFRDMTAAAARDGFFLGVVSAYRPHWKQHQLKRERGNLAAKPGWSTHQQGVSIDIQGTTRTIRGKKYRTILYWWMKRNAKNYGFYNDVEGEPWHWTYVGDGTPSKHIRKKKVVTNPGDYI